MVKYIKLFINMEEALMQKLSNLNPNSVFKFFEEISSIPRGSGNMKNISDYCVKFAKEHNLKYIKDSADNVIIYKNGSKGYENSESIILQGHLDIVCQKEDNCNIDFDNDGLDVYVQDGFVKARGTTLGADNGIAVSMILSILESDDIAHPPIEAVFTTDEEVGMLGALKLDFDNLNSKRMINLDSEEEINLTVSCAGGSDFVMTLPVERKKATATRVDIEIIGLTGGHSGVEIDKGRVNANIIAGRILNFAKDICDFDIIEINGGSKANAICNACRISIAVNNSEYFIEKLNEYISIIKNEISAREKNFDVKISEKEDNNFNAIDSLSKDKLIFTLLCTPNGVIDMSKEIEWLVETSLNLGILKTDDDNITFHFALRSNKESALKFLEDRLCSFAKMIGFKINTFGHYPSWEFNKNSKLQQIYKRIYKEKTGNEINVVAIHAGLECGVFASNINGFDGISIGPWMYDVHTTKEKLDVKSTENVYNLLLDLLRECK